LQASAYDNYNNRDGHNCNHQHDPTHRHDHHYHDVFYNQTSESDQYDKVSKFRTRYHDLQYHYHWDQLKIYTEVNDKGCDFHPFQHFY
jgi:hypothetical protein